MKASQERAVANHRRRLRERGLARYEVRGLAQDKQLVRELARRLASNTEDAERLRAEITKEVCERPPRVGGIVQALLNSPLAGADLQIEHEIVPPRDVDL